MRPFVADVNVWLAYLYANHEHHHKTRAWFQTIGPGRAVMCRIVQLTLARLLTNRTIMGEYVLTARGAWTQIELLLDDDRVALVAEPQDLVVTIAGLLPDSIPTSSFFNDAYLAAFAISSNRTLVTFDRGFQKFPGLGVDLLERFSSS